MFQIVIVFALLKIDYPPKVDAFFVGFELASLNMPIQYNFVEMFVPGDILQKGKTD